MRRFRLVNLLLVGLIALAAWRIYDVWRRPPPQVRVAGAADGASARAVPPPLGRPAVQPLVSAIAAKDLFDPSRKPPDAAPAAGPTPTPAPPPTLKLAGVVLLGDAREAVFVDTAQGNKQIRLRIGEEISGYRLASIGEERVALVSGGGEKVELSLPVEKGRKAVRPLGPGGRPTPRPTPRRVQARAGAQPAAAYPRAFGPQATRPGQGPVDERERQREEARRRAQRARERLKRLRAEAAARARR